MKRINLPKEHKNYLDGRYRDIIYYKDGRVVEIPEKKDNKIQLNKNLIVYAAGDLMAGLFFGDSDFTAGYGTTYFALGHGNVSWDSLPDFGLSNQTLDKTQLIDEFFRILPTQKVYIDDFGGSVSLTRTRFIRLIYEITASQIVGETIREFGLFAGNATSSQDSGTLFDYVVMHAFYKDPSINLWQRHFEIKF